MQMASVNTVSYKKILVGTGAALIANLAVFLVGTAAGATWNVGLAFTVSLPMVAVATLLPMLLGGQAVRLLGKGKPALITWAAWLVLVFSIAGSPSGWIASQNAPTGLALGGMHFVVGIAWFFSTRPNKTEPTVNL
jgi:hypothetical protein